MPLRALPAVIFFNITLFSDIIKREDFVNPGKSKMIRYAMEVSGLDRAKCHCAKAGARQAGTPVMLISHCKGCPVRVAQSKMAKLLQEAIDGRSGSTLAVG